MKKELLLSVLLFSVVFCSCYAAKTWKQTLNEYAVNLLECKPSTIVFKGYLEPNDLVDKEVYYEETFKIYGKNGNNCRFREESGRIVTKCDLPMNLTKQYANDLLKVLKMTEMPEMNEVDMMTKLIMEEKYCRLIGLNEEKE